MAENHIPRARLKAAKKSRHLFPDMRLREDGGAPSTASSSVLTGVPPAGSAFARRWSKAAATVEVLRPLFGVLSLLAAEASTPLSTTFVLCLCRPPQVQPMELPLGQLGEGDPLLKEVSRQS